MISYALRWKKNDAVAWGKHLSSPGFAEGVNLRFLCVCTRLLSQCQLPQVPTIHSRSIPSKYYASLPGLRSRRYPYRRHRSEKIELQRATEASEAQWKAWKDAKEAGKPDEEVEQLKEKAQQAMEIEKGLQNLCD